MFFPLILIVIIILLIVIVIIDHRVMQNKLETETYSKDQLVTKISTVTRENTQLKNQMLNIDGNNDTHHHGLRKAKQDLNSILNQYKNEGVIQHFDIIATGNLAVKHPLFEYARTFDYVVITEKGIFNINVKNWKQKTFYHFTADTTNSNESKVNDNIDQTVGRYIANQFHSQFQSTRSTTYTFIERIKNNSVTYDFYNYDPFEQSSINTQALEAKIYEKLNQQIKNIGLVYFTDGSVNIIDGPSTRRDYVETVSSKSSLQQIIGDTVQSTDQALTKEQYDKLVARFY
ncbi:NERD domain-containing protein [Staphylococcus sp. GDK8D68P]|uniref:NERD domain-containing protein n=1 Tax=Staphylococcus sp. GDK8D68P TaxID=2804092 RepID=UPI001AEC606D|nr:NERD domain-containing protein [Staphylococcus sp. GDK8D68P]